MIDFKSLLATTTLVAGAALAYQASPPLPQGHPTVEKAPAKELEPVVAAPEDVASIDAIIESYYSSISGPAGEKRNWDRFRSLFLGDAKLITARPIAGGVLPVVLTPADFIEGNASYFEAGGYFETEMTRRLEEYGNIAHAFSSYASRRTLLDPEPYARGINSFQLLKAGGRWWISAVQWDYERPDENPIPARYLP